LSEGPRLPVFVDGKNKGKSESRSTYRRKELELRWDNTNQIKSNPTVYE